MKNDVTKYLAAIGRRGGKSTSEAKRAAARENGRKGGKPKKVRDSQTHGG